MALFTRRELKRLLHPHYLVTLLLALSYLILKKTPHVSNYLFASGSDFDHRESEILFFTAAVIVFRTRKQGAVNLLPYVSTACMFAKLGNVLLYFYTDPIYGVIFVLLCLFQLLWLPEPSYQGPESMTYFRSQDLEEQVRKGTGVWFVELYTAWNPACVNFSNVYSELSANFTLDNLKFGKVDLSHNPDTATKYKINTSPLSKQLPTLILFKDGKELMRKPFVQSNGKLAPFSFTYENIVTDYNLNQLYQECKESLRNRKAAVKSKDD